MDILLEKKSIFLLWINHFIHLETLPRQKFSSSYSLEPFQLVQSISNKIGVFTSLCTNWVLFYEVKKDMISYVWNIFDRATLYL